MRKITSLATAFIAVVVLVASAGSAVYAQSSSAGLGITPRKDIVVEPGKSVTDKLQLINLDSNKDLRATLEIVDFGAKDQTGTPSLQLNNNAKQTAWSLKPFLKAPSVVTVPAGQSKYVDFTVTIPAGQGAGSYYSAIRYIAEGTDQGQVSVGASGATLMFVTVPGKTKESLILQKFGAYVPDGADNGTYKSLFVKNTPQEIAYTLKNQGNVAERPTGSILVKNSFGKMVKLVKDANPKASLALIGQTRLFDTCIDQPERNAEDQDCKKVSLSPGRYTIELNAFYGINGNQTQEIVGTASFWYLPVWFLIVLGIILLVIAGAIFWIYRKMNGRRSFKQR
jgi:hypothetical protein